MIIIGKGQGKILLCLSAVIILCMVAGYLGKEAGPDPSPSVAGSLPEVVGDIEPDPLISEQTGLDFFAEYRMERERVRSKEVENLKEVINQEKCSQEARDAAALRLVKISETVEKEVKTESLIKSQGYKDCAIIIQAETTTVVVLSSTLRLDQEEELKKTVSRSIPCPQDSICVIAREE